MKEYWNLLHLLAKVMFVGLEELRVAAMVVAVVAPASGSDLIEAPESDSAAAAARAAKQVV